MPEPRLLNGRYELGDLIGAGGSARVHRARDRLLDRAVAVKLLDAAAARTADPAAHDRFMREARTSAGFAHRHSVATYDAGDADGQLFLVMELVEGPSLAQRIASDAPMPESDIVRVGVQVLAALGAAHAAGLIHRDVKPANVLLDRAGDAKLADFGIAKRFGELTDSLTAAGMVIGTRDYLAPEQAAGAEVGPAADLYALGVVLYEMATGERPPRPAAGPGADPRSVRPGLSAGVATAISTALAPSPSDRFASADTMATAISGELPPTELSLAAPRRTTPGTLVMPVGAVMSDGAGAAPDGNGARTTIMNGRTGATTAVPDPPPRDGPGGSGVRWTLAATLLLAVFVATVVLASRTPDGSSTADGGSSPTSSVAQLAVATPSAATTAPTSTTAPPTTPAATVASTTPPTEPPPAEIVPGFPDTDDYDTFVEQLRDAKDVAGKQAKKLSDELRKIRDEDDPDERADRIDDLYDDLEEWLEKGQIESAIASRAIELVADL